MNPGLYYLTYFADALTNNINPVPEVKNSLLWLKVQILYVSLNCYLLNIVVSVADKNTMSVLQ